MQPDEGRPTRWYMTVLHYVAWLVATALVALNAMLARGVVNLALLRIGAGMSEERQISRQARGAAFGWTATVTDMLATIVLACVGLGFIVGIEYYFRQGVRRGVLMKRIAKVLVIGALLAGALYGVSLLLA